MKHVEFNIPAVRGMQGGHAFYTAMCPIRLLPRLFPVGVDQSTSDSHQSFRKVNLARVREIAKDIVAHHDDFHFAGIGQCLLNRSGHVATESRRFTIIDVLRIHDNADFTSSLDGECLLDTGKAAGESFQFLQPPDILFERFAPRSRS